MFNRKQDSSLTLPDALLLKSTEAARALSISPRLLWTLTKRGEIRAVRTGRVLRYDPADLREWIRRRKVGPATGSADLGVGTTTGHAEV